ncbi:hypothetical protein ABC733_27355 [Mangrovibacter sp. SLW1]
MRFIPARLSGKLLSGGVIILAVTVLIVYFTMQWFARPRIIDASNQLILQAGNNLSANIDQQLKKLKARPSVWPAWRNNFLTRTPSIKTFCQV